MQKINLLCSLALILLLAQGCAFNRTVVNGHVSKMDTSFIQPGKTTGWEVIDRLGPPPPKPENYYEKLYSENFIRYTCYETKTIGFQIAYFIYLPWWWQDAQAVDETLITLDDNGVVKDVIKTKRSAIWTPLTDEAARPPATCTRNGKGVIMKNLIITASLVTALMLLSGCHTGAAGKHTLYSQSKTLKTRDEVLKAFGGPSVVFLQNGNEAYMYQFNRTKGGAFGLGHFGQGLLVFGKDTTATDQVTFVMDKNGNVIKRQPGPHAAHTVDYKMNPFE